MPPPWRSFRTRAWATGSQTGSGRPPPRRRGEPGTSCASSANLFAVGWCPPRVWIDGRPVLTELDIEDRLTRATRPRHRGGCNLRTAPHRRNRLTGQHKLPDIDRDPIHARQDHMIPAAGIEDQEFAIRTVRARVDHPAVAGSGNLGALAGGDRNALFAAPAAVRGAEI